MNNLQVGQKVVCFGYDGSATEKTISEIYPETKEFECHENGEVLGFSDVIEVI
jgi:hypothetical protein